MSCLYLDSFYFLMMSRILVCDDDIVTLNVVRLKLTSANIATVITAEDGEQGIELIKKEDFDLIITDLQMPYKSGLELVRAVRHQFKKKTPIIVLSSDGLEDIVMEALQLGVDDFITKPFNANELLLRVKKLL
jgi:DNA-binding response OmpR family regulator